MNNLENAFAQIGSLVQRFKGPTPMARIDFSYIVLTMFWMIRKNRDY